MPGYGEAMAYANEMAEYEDAKSSALHPSPTRVISTYTDVASPFMITLYYTQYDPYEFMETAQWKDLGAEFQVASAFGRFTFGLPDERPKDAIYVVTKNEAGMFSEEEYTFTTFGDFVVLVPNE